MSELLLAGGRALRSVPDSKGVQAKALAAFFDRAQEGEITMHKMDDVTITGSLTLKHPDAKIGLRIAATPTGAGIWIGDEKCFVAIHNIDGQVCLALSGPGNEGHPHTIGISVDPVTGEPAIQLCLPGKEPKIVSGERLAELLP